MTRGHATATTLLFLLGCAGGTGPRPDAGGSGDAGEGDAGATDAGFDAGVDAGGRDAGDVPLPERCNPEVEYFEDEFGRQAYCIFVATTGDDDTGDGTVTMPFATINHARQNDALAALPQVLGRYGLTIEDLQRIVDIINARIEEINEAASNKTR